MGPSPERAPLAPNPQNQWLLSPINETLRASWATGWGLDEVFIDWGAGVKTNRNGLAIAFTEIELLSRMETFVDPQVPTEELENQYRFKSNYQWSTDRARRRLSELGISAKAIRKYLFRPFDQRLVYWDSQIVFNMRGGKMNVFSEQEPAVALLFSRSTSKDTYTNAFVSTVIPDHDCLERTKVAPIRRSQTSATDDRLSLESPSQSNFRNGLIDSISDVVNIGHGPTDVQLFNYIYAVLNSPSYRSIFLEFLRHEYPRIPRPHSGEFFSSMSDLGGRLVATHLLGEPPDPGAFKYDGPKSPAVTRPAWANGKIWLDARSSDARAGHIAIDTGTSHFQNVSEDAWRYKVGGHQVLHKWLSERRG